MDQHSGSIYPTQLQLSKRLYTSTNIYLKPTHKLFTIVDIDITKFTLFVSLIILTNTTLCTKLVHRQAITENSPFYTNESSWET